MWIVPFDTIVTSLLNVVPGEPIGTYEFIGVNMAHPVCGIIPNKKAVVGGM